MISLNTTQIIRRIIGETEPYGETRTDEVRAKNQDELIEICESLVDELIRNSKYDGRIEYSMDLIGGKAKNYLIELRDYLNAVID